MKLLGSTKSMISKDRNGVNVRHLEIIEILFVTCIIVNKDHQQESRLLCMFIPNKSLAQLLDISLKNFIKAFNSKFSYTEVWFTDQSWKPLEIEGKVNITFIIH